jgi:single-stranded-DNA-specific exonuclease
LSLQTKRWVIEPQVSQEQLSRLPDLQPLVVQLLHNRGLESPDSIQDYLAGHVPRDNPFQIKGMNKAVTRLRRAIDRGEAIAVYGDFDADGVTATALLVETLSALGARVMPYIPDRVKEGYGLNLDALRKLYIRGIRVVVTVDCGIRSIREIREASKGMSMIITDHHTPLDELPPALSIINPKQPDCFYPYENLAGVGLAYKLAQGLLRAQASTGRGCDLSEDSLLDLVAMGTVADLAPLQGENRSLVRRGLGLMNEAQRPGIKALMAEAGVRRGEVDAAAIGFRLGPRLNAAGRMDTAMLAYRLLTCTESLEARELAERLGKLNRDRQTATEEIVAAAENQVEADDPNTFLLMAAGEDFWSGIVGLAASRLTEKYYRPSVVVELGEEKSRGSCRSIPEFDITGALDLCADLLIRHGGHKAAAGFSVATRSLDTLRQRLQAIATEKLAGKELRPTVTIDAEIHLEEVNWATHALLSQIEPCGVENPQPVLLSTGIAVRGRRAIGKEGKHLKLTLSDGRGAAWDAIYFRAGHLVSEIPGQVDAAYTLEANEWNHRKRLQLNVQDLRATNAEKGSL